MGPPMRRLLLILLLVFMPFQAIWAAASPYCSHEVSTQASHFGHHAHEHGASGHSEAQPPPAESPTELHALAAAGTADMDCHACHTAGGPIAPSVGVPALLLAASPPPQRPARAWVHPPASRPERPNWPALA